MSDLVNQELNDLASRAAGHGGLGSTTYSAFSGLNLQGGIPSLPHNTDTQGMVFFTRPCMNLTYNNVRDIRTMAFLTNKDRDSIGNALRCILNPRGIDRSIDGGDNYRSTLIDDKSPFIALLSNSILSLSGWPDLVPYMYNSPAGIGSEEVSWVDGRSGILNKYTLTATFANMEGDPISALFYAWVEYSQRVSEGTMVPFPINIVENRIDYQTRIYRLVLDRTKTYIQKISATGASFPEVAPIGAAMNFSTDSQFNNSNNQITIPFRCMGAMYNDPILIYEFNKIVEMYNPQMINKEGMIKLAGIAKHNVSKRSLMNYKAYPYISGSMELEWWANKVEYDNVLKILDVLDTTVGD